MAIIERPTAPDCANCWRRGDCPNATEGDFCAKWQSAKPMARESDPNDLWNRGEDVSF